MLKHLYYKDLTFKNPSGTTIVAKINSLYLIHVSETVVFLSYLKVDCVHFPKLLNGKAEICYIFCYPNMKSPGFLIVINSYGAQLFRTPKPDS